MAPLPIMPGRDESALSKHDHQKDGKHDQHADGVALHKEEYPAGQLSVVTAVFSAAFAPCFAASRARLAYSRLSFHFCAYRESGLLVSSGCSWTICRNA